jgi:two-component system sensor histidine kinase ChiS
MSSRNMKWILAPFALYIAAVIVLPYRVHINMKYSIFLYLGIAVLYIIGRMVYLYGQSRGDSNDRQFVLIFYP